MVLAATLDAAIPGKDVAFALPPVASCGLTDPEARGAAATDSEGKVYVLLVDAELGCGMQQSLIRRVSCPLSFCPFLWSRCLC